MTFPNAVYVVISHSSMMNGYGDEYVNVAVICDSVESAKKYIFNAESPYLLDEDDNDENILINLRTGETKLADEYNDYNIPDYHTIEIMEVKHYDEQ